MNRWRPFRVVNWTQLLLLTITLLLHSISSVDSSATPIHTSPSPTAYEIFASFLSPSLTPLTFFDHHFQSSPLFVSRNSSSFFTRSLPVSSARGLSPSTPLPSNASSLPPLSVWDSELGVAELRMILDTTGSAFDKKQQRMVTTEKTSEKTTKSSHVYVFALTFKLYDCFLRISLICSFRVFPI